MTNTNRLTVLHGGPGSGKTPALIARYQALSQEERSRAAFLTVSRPAARELERRLRDAGADPIPPIWTLPQLPSEVLRAAGAAPPRALSETDRQRLLAWLLAAEAGREDAPERIRRWAASRRAVAADLSAAAGLLQRHRVSPAEFRDFAEAAAGADLLTAVARMYASYVNPLSASGATDFDGLNERALCALEGLNRPPLPDLLFVDEAQEMDALQIRLVAALSGTGGRVVAAADAWQRTQMYRGAVRDVAAALAAAMGESAEVTGCAGGAAGGILCAVAAGFGLPALPAGSPSVRHIVARTVEEEARLVAGELREAKGRRAVLTRSNRAATAMQEALRKEGIPVAAAWLGSAHAQRFLRDALTLLTVVRHDDEDGRAARLRSALRLLACSDAPDQEILDARKASAKRPDGPLPVRVQGWLDEAVALPSLAQQVHWLCCCSRWLPRLPAADRDAAARAYSGAMASLLGLEETWRAATGGHGPLPPAEAMSDLRGVLSAALYPDAEPSPAPDDEDLSGDHGRADLVDVLPVHQATGRHWDCVVLCELQDGGFPQYAVPSPFIPEEAAAEVRAWLEHREGRPIALGRFERRADVTVEEERRLFLTALSRATETATLACHVQEADRPSAPSWFFQRLLPSAMALSPQAPSAWRCLLKDTLPARDGGLEGCQSCGVERCSGREEAACALPDLEPAAPPLLAADPSAGAPALGPDWPLSATALNTFFACPRKFFLASAMRLTDEDTDSTAAGSALHEILERYNRAAPPRTWDTLRQAMDDVFGDARSGSRFSSEAAWLLTQRKIRRALEVFWSRAEDADADAAWVEEWLHFSLDDGQGASHAFAGKVDLAVPRADGIAIVDFKSSRPRKDAADLRKKMPAVNAAGEVEAAEDGDVQLPLYAAGAIARGLSPVSVAHDYITVSRPGEGQRITIPILARDDAPPDGKGVLIREELEAFARFFGDTARAIKGAAAFAADPASGECEAYNAACPFAAVCDRERSDA